MRGDHEYVQAIKLINKDNEPVIDIQGTFVQGETQTYELEEDEKIIGCYGIYNY